jgi:hypothetical protein
MSGEYVHLHGQTLVERLTVTTTSTRANHTESILHPEQSAILETSSAISRSQHKRINELSHAIIACLRHQIMEIGNDLPIVLHGRNYVR